MNNQEYIPVVYQNIKFESGYKILKEKAKGIASLRKKYENTRIAPNNPNEMPRIFDHPFNLDTIIFELEGALKDFKDNFLERGWEANEEDVLLELKLTEKYGFLHIGETFSNTSVKNNTDYWLLESYIYDRSTYQKVKEFSQTKINYEDELNKQKKIFRDDMSDYSEFVSWRWLILELGYLKKHRKRNTNITAQKADQNTEVEYFINEQMDSLIHEVLIQDLKLIYPSLNFNGSKHYLKSNCLLGNILIRYLANGPHSKTKNCIVCEKEFIAKRSDAKFCEKGGKCSKKYQTARKNNALDVDGNIRFNNRNEPILKPE